MSSNRKKRIKGLRTFTNANPLFNPLVPFGADGDLIDIFSGLDLEEQLIIGGNKTISFTDVDQHLTVKEKFFNFENQCIYTKISELITEPIYQLIQATTEQGQEGQLGYIENQEDTFIGDFYGKTELDIKISLYKGDVDEEDSKLLHIKRITVHGDEIEERIEQIENEENEGEGNIPEEPEEEEP